MALVEVKVGVMVLIAIIPFGFALLPWLIQVAINMECCRIKNGVRAAENVLNYLNFVAGGIFLGLILLHMIPEVQEELAESLEKLGVKTHYPVGPFLVAFGLVAFVVLEQIVMYCRGGGQHTQSASDQDVEGEGTGLTMNQTRKRQYRSYESIPVDDIDVISSHERQGKGQNSLLRTYALLVALSLHSIFEGTTIGFQTTESVIWELFVAIIFHKCLVAFSLGSRLLKAMQQLSLKHYFGLIIVFCMMAPLGGTIAALVSGVSDSTALKITENILSALATGSFMFVTFFEILRFDNESNVNLLSVFCLIIGFGAYALEMYLEGDSHGH